MEDNLVLLRLPAVSESGGSMEEGGSVEKEIRYLKVILSLFSLPIRHALHLPHAPPDTRM